jgi:hypothetical protein
MINTIETRDYYNNLYGMRIKLKDAFIPQTHKHTHTHTHTHIYIYISQDG